MKKCIVCSAPLFEKPLLHCENFPQSAQGMPAAEDLKDEKGIDVDLCQCSGCGLVQLDCEPVGYFRDVIRAGGFTTTMVELRRRQYRHFIETCGLEHKKIIEVGCGRGEFLGVLKEFSVEVYGVEHKPDLAAAARENGLNVECCFAENGDTDLPGAPFDAFLSFNFLEHQPDPNGMMACIARNLADGGYGLITVPSWEYISGRGGYYELLRDHIAYYTEKTLGFLMEKNGFEVLETDVVNRDTVQMIVRKRLPEDVGRLKNGYERLKAELQKFVEGQTALGRKIAVWGAGHQAFTALSCMGIGDKISYIIDSAPFKQGRYSPASHLPIVAPEHFFAEPVQVILIAAPGYTDEIAGTVTRRFGKDIAIATLRDGVFTPDIREEEKR